MTALLQQEAPFHTGSPAQIMSQHMYLSVPPLKRPADVEPVPVLLEKLRLDMLAKDAALRPPPATVVRERFVAAPDPDARELLLPSRKAGTAMGDRAARAVEWQPGPTPCPATLAADDGAIVVALFRNAPTLVGGIDDDCVLGLAAQNVRVSPSEGASSELPEGISAVVVDVGADFDSACAAMRDIRKRDTRRAVIVCLDALTTEKMPRLIEAGATDVDRYPVRSGDLARKIARALRNQGR